MDRTPSDAVQARAALTRGSGAGIAIASIVSGASGYLVLVIAARTLDTATNASFLVFWAILFGIYGVLGGIQNETVRAASTAAARASSHRGPRLVAVAGSIGVVLAVVLSVSGLAWGEPLLGAAWAQQLGWLAAGVAAFSVHVALTGTLSGQAAWNTYAALIAGESTVRLAATVAVAIVGGTIGGLSAAAALASFTWITFLLAPSVRRAATARADVPLADLLRGIAHAAAAAAASSVLVVGFPVLLRLTSGDAEYDTAAPLLLAVVLTRGPLLLPLGAYQGVVIAHVVRHRELGLRALAPAVRLVAALGIVGTVLATLLGPPVLRAIDADYVVGAATFAALLVAATGIALVTLTGAACLALGRHRAYSTGWIVATIVTVGVLAMPLDLDLDVRVCASLLAGPALGAALHCLALRTTAR